MKTSCYWSVRSGHSGSVQSGPGRRGLPGPRLRRFPVSPRFLLKICLRLLSPTARLPAGLNRPADLAPPTGEAEQAVYVIDCGLPLSPVGFGKVSKEAGEASYAYINRAIDLALSGQVKAVVTGPIHKEAINAAGCPHPGHTEIFASRTGTNRYAMMLVHGNLRVSHVSTHVSSGERATSASGKGS